jgi:HEAT repeat protein
MATQPDLLIRKLIEKLGDRDPLVRRNAAGALRMQGPRAVEALPALRTLIDDEDPRVRNEAEQAVARLREHDLHSARARHRNLAARHA